MQERGIITEDHKKSLLQNEDLLEIRIETVELAEIETDQKMMISFFHQWFYHLVNNAQYRFYKHLAQERYGFGKLFEKVLAFMKKAAKSQRNILKTDFMEALFSTHKKPKPSSTDTNLSTFLVPIIRQQSGYHINWTFISDLITFI